MTEHRNVRTLGLALALIGAFSLADQAKAFGVVSSFVIDLSQDGPNVVATENGAINTTGLTFVASEAVAGSVIDAGLGTLGINPITGQMGTLYDSYTGPRSFGTDTSVQTPTSTSTGADLVVMDNFASGYIIVPDGYVSGTELTGTATWDDATFSSLGVTPGIYTWSWDGGANTFVINAESVVPEPSQYGFFIALAVTGLIAWRRFSPRASPTV